MGLTLFSCGIAHGGKGVVSVFRGFYAGIGRAFGAALSSHGVETPSWYFLVFWDLKLRLKSFANS